MRRSAAGFSYREKDVSSRRRLIAASLIAVLLFAADFVSGGALRVVVRTASGAVWQAGARIEHAVAGSGFFATRAQLAAENADLRAQLERYMEKATAAEALAQENDQLRALTHLAAEVPGITAPIVSSFRTSPYGTFFVGAGTADGVAQDDLVATPDGFVIGRVSDASSHTALVNQIFAPRAKLDVLAGKVPLSLTGEGGGNARGTAPREAAIAAGDIVTAPSLGGRAVAVVGSVTSDPSDAESVIMVRAPSNLTTLQFVYIMHTR